MAEGAVTPDRLREIAARVKKATAGPWRNWNFPILTVCAGGQPVCDFYFGADKLPDAVRADALFVAHARQDIPDLLEHIAELKTKLARTCLETVDEDGTPFSACGQASVGTGPFCAHCGGRIVREDR